MTIAPGPVIGLPSIRHRPASFAALFVPTEAKQIVRDCWRLPGARPMPPGARVRVPATGLPGAAHSQAGYLDTLSETGRRLRESRVGGTNGAKPGTPGRGLGFFPLLFLLLLAVPVQAAAERREAVDADRDGKPEEWKIYDGQTPVRVERDRDGDGKPEVWIYLQDGKPVRSEVDRNGDGKPDLIRWMKEGRSEREQADLNLDGKADGWVFYKEGVKDLMIMDKNYDGRPDAWFYYDQAGLKLTGDRIDGDFDGKTERTWGSFPDKEARKPW